ncbi:DUF333 domain-containing protein [Klebsiella aerogenes]|uniref:DUF333 domain-containing protein n=1 Tax=Klebsiella aerogenes TaxID=548 RepID=UPI0037B08FCA
MKSMFLASSVMLISGCTVQSEQHNSIGRANPASVNCIQQGGKSDRVRTDKGDTGYCTLPSGERIEEWALFHRDSKNKA